jgi:hypothetical protein
MNKFYYTALFPDRVWGPHIQKVLGVHSSGGKAAGA